MTRFVRVGGSQGSVSAVSLDRGGCVVGDLEACPDIRETGPSMSLSGYAGWGEGRRAIHNVSYPIGQTTLRTILLRTID